MSSDMWRVLLKYQTVENMYQNNINVNISILLLVSKLRRVSSSLETLFQERWNLAWQVDQLSIKCKKDDFI